MATKRKASRDGVVDESPTGLSNEFVFTCLGGGQEVGRSSHIIQYKGKTIMLDAGMHSGRNGIDALPFYDAFDLETVDIILISHFHIDHTGSLPYVLAKTNFKGHTFMTHPTKAIYKWLIQDSIRVGNMSTDSKNQLYDEADHLSTFPSIETIDFNTTHFVSSVRITPYPAGHVLGAAMFLIEIDDLKILFTGDYSCEEDRHLIPASVPDKRIDVLITESTYGTSAHVPRKEREAGLMQSITTILDRGGRALLPVIALGRAQELLLILEEYWKDHPEYQKIPIYYASYLARRCMMVYQTYISAMNGNIKRLFQERIAEAEATGKEIGNTGPWDFKYIRSLKTLDNFHDVGSCVVLASPGMMQNGVSRELLERWAPEEKNGVVITGYNVEGTMARHILQEPEQIQAISNKRAGVRTKLRPNQQEDLQIPRRCTIHEHSFSAHVDGVENMEFIRAVAAPVVILVHGGKPNMLRLKSKLLSTNKAKEDQTMIFSPANCEEVRIPFSKDMVAKVVGRLAQVRPPGLLHSGGDGQSGQRPVDVADQAEENQTITGVLIRNDPDLTLVAPEDLQEYTGLATVTVTCRQHLNLSAAGIDLIRWGLTGTFGTIREAQREDESHNSAWTTLTVMDSVLVHCHICGKVEVEWEGNLANDMIAEAVLAALFSVESSPAALKQLSKQNTHVHSLKDLQKPNVHNPHAELSPEDRFSRLCLFLEAQFGPNVAPICRPRLCSVSNASPEAISIDNETDELSQSELLELQRLHSLGIPVPGVEIMFDGYVAKIWLEDLTVEVEAPANIAKTFHDRVKAVAERAVHCVNSLST